MEQLQSFYGQLQDMQKAFDDAIKQGKTFEDVKELYLQMKELKKTIYERKVHLKRSGVFEPRDN